MEFIKNTPWWLAIVLYITSVMLGIYVGTPIAVKQYQLSIPSEVNQLFALLAIYHFYYLLALCVAAAIGYKFLRSRKNQLIQFGYVVVCIMLIPTIFFGIEVSNYYK